MKQDFPISRVMDVIEECAFKHGAYGTEVLTALRTIRSLWNAGHSSLGEEMPAAPVDASSSEHQGRLQSEEDAVVLDADFCYELEHALVRATVSQREWMMPFAALDEVIARYEKMTHPKAFALLESLARQSDLEYSKWSKEGLMLKIAEFGARGVPLPPELTDIAGFSAPRFRNLSAQIPRGQSILDFYILNRIRHKVSRAAATVSPRVRESGVPRNIFFGTLEMTTPGAQIMPVHGADEYLVVLSRALWSATSLATAIITRCVNLDQTLPAPIGFDKSAAAELAGSLQMLDRILRCEELDFEFPGVTDERQKVFWEFFDAATKSFIFGHEFAHLLEGHLDRSTSSDTAHLWNQELFADILAVQLMADDQERSLNNLMQAVPPPAEVSAKSVEAAQQTMREVGLFHTASGAALVLYLFWRMDALHGRSASLHDSHPPVAIRLGNMWTFFRLTSVHFEKIFRFSNLMLRDFMSLLPPMGGGWRDQFQEVAFRPLMLHSYGSVIDLLVKVNTAEPLEDPSLQPVRAQLEALFKEQAPTYEQKYSVLEECIAMVRLSEQVDPLRSVKDAIKAE